MEKSKQLKQKLLLIAKLLFISAAVFVIVQNADMEKIGKYIATSNLFYLFVAYVSLMVSHLISAYRTQFYFSNEDVHLNTKFNIGLYCLGMLYNNVLPGGIGGDGYKVYKINKLTNFPSLSAVRLLLSDRASGFYMLIMLTLIMAFFIDTNGIPHYKAAVVLLMVINTIGYFICAKLILKEPPKIAVLAARYSFFVQILNIVSIYFIITGINGIISVNEILIYSSIFMISCVSIVIPVSIGGMGIRELVLFYGSSLMDVDPEKGVAIALMFFVINFISSLTGLAFLHKLDNLYIDEPVKEE